MNKYINTLVQRSQDAGGGFLRRFLDAQRPGASRMFGHCVRDTRETVSFCLNAEEPNASVLDIGPNNNGLAPRSVRVFEDSEIVSLFPPQQDHRERASSNTIWGGSRFWTLWSHRSWGEVPRPAVKHFFDPLPPLL